MGKREQEYKTVIALHNKSPSHNREGLFNININ